MPEWVPKWPPGTRCGKAFCSALITVSITLGNGVEQLPMGAGGPAPELRGLNRRLRRPRHIRIVDRHLVAVHDDLDADGQRLIAGAVVVEKGLGAVDAVRHGAD